MFSAATGGLCLHLRDVYFNLHVMAATWERSCMKTNTNIQRYGPIFRAIIFSFAERTKTRGNPGRSDWRNETQYFIVAWTLVFKKSKNVLVENVSIEGIYRIHVL